jgi:MFS family permease
MFFATAVMALLPIVAARVSANSLGYGVLLGCFGAGAVVSALLLPWARARLSLEGILSGALAVLGVALIAAGTLHSLVALGPFMLIGGAAWMTFISLLTTAVQQLAPAWVRARVLAVFMLASQGSLALGSLAWGLVAEHQGVTLALLIAGAGTFAAILLRFVAPMPSVDVDLTTWIHWREPAHIADLGYDVNDGPVLVSIEYHVVPERAAAFVQAAHRLGRMRRRDGASRWGLFRDTEAPDVYLESCVVDSWAEHLRQHERPVKADQALETAVGRTVLGTPKVRHFLYASNAPRK